MILLVESDWLVKKRMEIEKRRDNEYPTWAPKLGPRGRDSVVDKGEIIGRTNLLGFV